MRTSSSSAHARLHCRRSVVSLASSSCVVGHPFLPGSLLFRWDRVGDDRRVSPDTTQTPPPPPSRGAPDFPPMPSTANTRSRDSTRHAPGKNQTNTTARAHTTSLTCAICSSFPSHSNVPFNMMKKNEMKNSKRFTARRRGRRSFPASPATRSVKIVRRGQTWAASTRRRRNSCTSSWSSTQSPSRYSPTRRGARQPRRRRGFEPPRTRRREPRRRQPPLVGPPPPLLPGVAAAGAEGRSAVGVLPPPFLAGVRGVRGLRTSGPGSGTW